MVPNCLVVRHSRGIGGFYGVMHALITRRYLVSELQLTGLDDDYVVDWEISVEDGFQVRFFLLFPNRSLTGIPCSNLGFGKRE